MTGATKGVEKRLYAAFNLAAPWRHDPPGFHRSVTRLPSSSCRMTLLQLPAYTRWRIAFNMEWAGGSTFLSINVGGTETKPGGFEVLSDEDWQQNAELNLLAAVRLDRIFHSRHDRTEFRGRYPYLLDRPPHAVFPPRHWPYAAAKGSSKTYGKGRSAGVAKNGVRVTMISTWLHPNLKAHGMIMDISKALPARRPPAKDLDMLGGIPVGRPTPEGQPVSMFQHQIEQDSLSAQTTSLTCLMPTF